MACSLDISASVISRNNQRFKAGQVSQTENSASHFLQKTEKTEEKKAAAKSDFFHYYFC